MSWLRGRKIPEYRLGDILLKRGLINPRQLEEALAKQRETGAKVGEILVSQGLITKHQLHYTLAQQVTIRTAAAVFALMVGATTHTAARAATAGQIGDVSTASATITVTVPKQVQISRLDDIQISVRDRDQDVSFVEPLCVRGVGAGEFRVRASGSGPNEAFSLQSLNSDSRQLPFSVGFIGELAAGGTDELIPGHVSPSYRLQSTRPDCGGVDSSAVTIGLSADDLAQIPAGTYRGVLTLTVAPE